MMSELFVTNSGDTPTGRPTPTAGWSLLSQGLTGYDWHGGFYAAPAAPRPAPRRSLVARLRERRAARELRGLTARERADARLPQATGAPRQRETLWERAAAWASARTPGGPCPDGAC
jgi:hypothetical protein